MAMVLMDRRMPTAFVKVRNVFGLLSAVKTTMTIRIAITRPPIRIPAARARPDQRSPADDAPGGWTGAMGAVLWVIRGPLLVDQPRKPAGPVGDRRPVRGRLRRGVSRRRWP